MDTTRAEELLTQLEMADSAAAPDLADALTAALADALDDSGPDDPEGGDPPDSEGGAL
jgi:hypothetical protein